MHAATLTAAKLVPHNKLEQQPLIDQATSLIVNRAAQATVFAQLSMAATLAAERVPRSPYVRSILV